MADRGPTRHRLVLWSLLLLLLRLPAAIRAALPQTSNYAEHGLDVEYQGNGIPQEAVLDGVVTKLDELSHVIRTNRTTATLSCASRGMDVNLEFAEPFYGIVYADFDRHSACNFVGRGELTASYQLPLSGCGTLQDPLRVFTNNLIVRFHPSLEMDGDEVKTIVCRYPEPIVPPPLGPPLPVSVLNTPPLLAPPAGLNELQILLIICALLFLALMLFGVAFSYFCLKQRNVKLIRRRHALSSAPGSIDTKISESTLQLPVFEGLKIPRAHASSNSGSDQVPAEQSDTLPSDYPSESRSGSEMEQFDVRRPASSVSSICQQQEVPPCAAPVEDDRLSSVYSDAPPQSEYDMFGAPTRAPEPSFDVAFRVTNPPRAPHTPSPPSSVASEDARSAVMRAQERTLSTILEREEWRQSAAPVPVEGEPQRVEPLDGPAANECPPVVSYAQVQHRPRSLLSQRSIPDNDNWSETETFLPADERRKPPEVSFRVHHRQPEEPRTPSESEYSTRSMHLRIDEDVQRHTTTFHHVREDDEKETMIVPTGERPVPPPKLQEIDDLLIRTVQEKRIVEENERLRRQVLEFHQRPQPALPPPEWNVEIRKHQPVFERRPPSDSTDVDPPNWDVQIRQHPPVHEPRTPSESNWDADSVIPPDWKVQVRQRPPVYEPREPSESTDWDATSQPPEAPEPQWDVQIRQHPPVVEPRTPSESNWDADSVPPPEAVRPDWDVKIRQHPPILEPRTPSESNWDADSVPPPEAVRPDWDVKIRQHPPILEPRTPSESNWDADSVPPPESARRPDWDVNIRQHPPLYEPREPSDSTDWDSQPDRTLRTTQVDDVYVRTVVERHTSDQLETSRRRTTEFRRRPAPPPPDWDVEIRQHPPVYERRPPSDSTDWDAESQPPAEPPVDWNVRIRQHPPVYERRPPSDSNWDADSQPPEEPPIDWDVRIRQHPPVYEPRPLSDSTDWDRTSRASSVPAEEAAPPNWDVLIRVLNPPEAPRHPHDDDDDDDTSSVLTVEDRRLWHRIITTESTLRSMLTECVVREDYERVRRDTRFRRIFEPRKWDVIIRVLSAPPPRDRSDARSDTTQGSSVADHAPPPPPPPPPPSASSRRFRRRSDAAPEPPRLAPVHEAHLDVPAPPSGRSSRVDEVRSLTETTVHYGTYHMEVALNDDDDDEASRPSLARSTTEFTENDWTASRRLPFDRVSDGSGFSSEASARGHRRGPAGSHPAGGSSSSGDSGDESLGRGRRLPYQRVSSSSSGGSEGRI